MLEIRADGKRSPEVVSVLRCVKTTIGHENDAKGSERCQLQPWARILRLPRAGG